MLLTITTTHFPASDLSYLLHKRPDRVQEFSLSFGTAHVFYPECNEYRCTAALLLDIDPIGLVRNRRSSGEGGLMDQYVNDRPFVASSFLSVAISKVLGSALSGKSADRADLAETAIPLSASLSVVRARGGETMIRGLLEPLGYTVSVEALPLDSAADSLNTPYYSLTIAGTTRLKDLLNHLYVLVPVLDNDKHYWVGEEEIEKLIRHGEGWLAGHPLHEQITRRYLKHKRSLAGKALSRILEDTPEVDQHESTSTEDIIEAPLRLNDQRMQTVLETAIATEARSVVDLGCGEGRLLFHLIKQKQFDRITGMDVSLRTLDIAADRLKLDRLPPSQQSRIQLVHGSLTYRDRRLLGYDLATVIEVIEHMDVDRLDSFERLLFGYLRPRSVIVTTPNAEYNVLFPHLPPGRMRHSDHRFEWDRATFTRWCEGLSASYGYQYLISGIGETDERYGAPTQMALFQMVQS